jgi:hypothetical protein
MMPLTSRPARRFSTRLLLWLPLLIAVGGIAVSVPAAGPDLRQRRDEGFPGDQTGAGVGTSPPV